MNIYCPKCEAANAEDAVVCSMCGHQLAETIKKPSYSHSAPRAQAKPRQLPSCRECQHPVSRSAKACPSCGARKPAVSRGAQVVAAVAVVGMAVVCSGVLDSHTPSKPQEGEKTFMAYRKVKDFVESRLVSPRTADWPYLDRTVTYLGGGRYRVRAYVDSQNRFGALIRSNVDAEVKWINDDDWVLVSLKIE